MFDDEGIGTSAVCGGETACNCGDTLTSDINLTADLDCSVNGITIGANNIKLNCSGFNISGSPGVLNKGISATLKNNITLLNCNIGGFRRAVSVTGTNYTFHNNTFHNITSNNGYGVTGPSNATFLNNTFNNVTYGIYSSIASNMTLRYNTFLNSNYSFGWSPYTSPQYCLHDIDATNTIDGRILFYSNGNSSIEINDSVNYGGVFIFYWHNI